MPHLERDALKCLLSYFPNVSEVLRFFLSFIGEVRNKELASVSGFYCVFIFSCMMGSCVTLTHSADKSELFLDVYTAYKDLNAWLIVLIIFWTLHFASQQ